MVATRQHYRIDMAYAVIAEASGCANDSNDGCAKNGQPHSTDLG